VGLFLPAHLEPTIYDGVGRGRRGTIEPSSFTFQSVVVSYRCIENLLGQASGVPMNGSTTVVVGLERIYDRGSWTSAFSRTLRCCG
jgi:hypothetical protein